MAGQTNCESCANYIYDEESDCYCQCPYYQLDDEYRIVRKKKKKKNKVSVSV